METDTQNNYNIENDNIQQLYEEVYNNIDELMLEYGHIIDPQYNNLTIKFMNNGYTLKEASSFTMTLLLLLYQQIISE